jgi:superfamily II DNA/RNA helicase
LSRLNRDPFDPVATDPVSLTPGDLVRVRQRTWLVEQVEVEEDASPVVRLACVDDDAQGHRLAVAWDAELDGEVIPSGRSSLQTNRRPDDPRTFAAYLHALRWGCVTSTDPTLFQAPLRAGIVPKAYQLEPLRKALSLPRVNLFIADDVGLGKTIEAGLVLQELLLRQRVSRVVIGCPASVVLQWRDEMSQRFGLTFVVMDKAYVNARRRERGFGVNPWTTHRHFIISHALLRDEDYLVGLRDWLDPGAGASVKGRGKAAGGQTARTTAGSLLILDEAHVAAPASQTRYAIDSQTTRAVRDLARRFEHRLFLSATPHNGHSNSFASLLEILDPQRFTRGVPVKNASSLKAVMVRRLKGELRHHGLGSQIPERETIQIDLSGLPEDAPELLLAAKLAAYGELLEQRLSGGTRRQQAAVKLVTIALQKRLLSSIEAFARTLSVHRRSAAAKLVSAPSAGPVLSPQSSLALGDGLADSNDEDMTEDDASALDDATVARATRTGGLDLAGEAEKLLDEMTEIAERNRDRPDAKMRALLDWVKKNQTETSPPAPLPEGRGEEEEQRIPRRPPGRGEEEAYKLPPRPSGRGGLGGVRWLPRRVLIFTEYTDTKNYLVNQLKAAIGGSDLDDDRLMTLHGGMDEEAREQVKQAFNDPSHPVRILVATDAAREGVNLQGCCADLFHFDLPWNPGRMEQRNGRIDRTLQPEPRVRCHYFFYTQRPEDEVLKALVQKTARIQKELGSLADVIERRLSLMLEGGIRRADARALALRIEQEKAEAESRQASDEELEQARDQHKALRAQLEELERLYEKSQDHLNLKTERLRDVTSLGLTMAGLPSLTPRSSPKGSYDVPGLDKIAASDPSWRDIADTLRAPRTRKMPEWEWRAQNPPRPVSFEPATSLASETVQLHLQHKLTQRALASFRAQAFGEEKLARVAIVIDPDIKRKRVLALGRLALYGTGASRLHEEVLAAAAYWVEGDDPARLKAFEKDAEEKTLETLSAVLTRPEQPQVPDHIVKLLMASAARDEEALWASLKSKARQRMVWAEEKLRQRGVQEANEMRTVLEKQRTAIEKELHRRGKIADEVQERSLQTLLPGFLPGEKDQEEQYLADTRHIEKRLGEIARELNDEPSRIQSAYEVKHNRLERVGLVYLWPASS